MTPPCWNRPPFAAGRWHATGRTVQSGERAAPGEPVQWGPVKPVYRWHPRWFADECRTWAGRGIGPTEETTHYPQAMGWADACQTCRWIPLEHKR